MIFKIIDADGRHTHGQLKVSPSVTLSTGNTKSVSHSLRYAFYNSISLNLTFDLKLKLCNIF